MEIRPSTKRTEARKPRASEPPAVSEAQAVVLVSCHEFAGRSNSWMSPEEEREFVSKTEANGRRVARLGSYVEEPWRLG